MSRVVEAMRRCWPVLLFGLVHLGTLPPLTLALSTPSPEDGWTHLHMVAGRGDLDGVHYLLDAGHPADPRLNTGHTPLHIAAQQGNTDVARILLEKAAAAVDARTFAGITPLYLALQKSQLGVARFLVESGASIDAQTETGNSALHMAAQSGKMEEASLLLKNGCTVDSRTMTRHTPLHLAVSHGHMEMTRLLLESGRAGVDVEDNTGRRPLHLAVQKGEVDVVVALLEHGASVNAVSSRGLTPLDIAAYTAPPPGYGKKESLAVVEALVGAGASVSSVHPWNKQTALHAAAFLGRQSLVDMLLDRGASRDGRFYFQMGDGIGERARASGAGDQGAQAAAYESAIREDPSCKAAYLRLGGCQERLEPSKAKGGRGSGDTGIVAQTFRKAWHLETKGSMDMDMDVYVQTKISMALAVTGNGVAAATLEDLTVRLDDSDAMKRALTLWRQQGVVIFPSLLNDSIVNALREDVRSATQDGSAVDRSSNIRSPSKRRLKALRVDQSSAALEAIAHHLAPFLDEALQDTKHLLLEHASYLIEPGAKEQDFHRDDSVIDSRIVSVQVSLVDTIAEMGVLEVQPATHHGDNYTYQAQKPTPALPIAVPQGSVVFYSPNVLHRGRANVHDKERIIVTLTLMGEHGLVPNGIPLAVATQDEGVWSLGAGRLTHK